MSKRTEQVAALLQRLISDIISKDMEIERDALITIARVEVPGDLKTAKVFVSVLPYALSDRVLQQLKRAKGFIQKEMSRDIEMKFSPKLKFEIDHQAEYASRIEALLDLDE